MTTKDIHENHERGPLLGLGSSEGLGPLVERLLKYSDIRRNDPRENREALRALIVGELADELQAVRKAEREQCVTDIRGLCNLARKLESFFPDNSDAFYLRRRLDQCREVYGA